MMKRICTAAMLSLGLFGLTLLAGSPLSIGWDNTLVFRPSDVLLLDSCQSILEIQYRAGSFLASSRSETQRFGFLWQDFAGSGRLGAFDLFANILFGADTSDYLYAQAICELTLAGVDIGLYCAHLGDAVFGGPADGSALRMAGSVGSLDIVSITEMGARIADDDFDGITIVHAATGLSRMYITDPLVAGQGFTGQKLTISELGFACIEHIGATLYITCEGFDFASLSLSGIDCGISWLTFDLALTFREESKTVLLTPALVVAETLCMTPYLDLSPNPETYMIDKVNVAGLDLTYSWNGVTFRDVTVFNPDRFAITTPEYGSGIESIADAVEDGHEFYADYWELFSIQIDGEACCGGHSNLLINTYFDEESDKIFGWGMTYVEGSIGITPSATLSLSVRIDATGINGVGVGFNLLW